MIKVTSIGPEGAPFLLVLGKAFYEMRQMRGKKDFRLVDKLTKQWFIWYDKIWNTSLKYFTASIIIKIGQGKTLEQKNWMSKRNLGDEFRLS